MMDDLQWWLERLAEYQSEQCGYCFHPKHEGKVCQRNRMVEVDGIEIDGPCGCQGEDIGYAH